VGVPTDVDDVGTRRSLGKTQLGGSGGSARHHPWFRRRGQRLRLLVLNAALEDVLHDSSRAGGDSPIAVTAQRHTRPGRGCGTIAGGGEET
jgi:hypothetical protein